MLDRGSKDSKRWKPSRLSMSGTTGGALQATLEPLAVGELEASTTSALSTMH